MSELKDENINNMFLQHNILNQFRSGDVIYDSLIAIFITSFVSLIINQLRNNTFLVYNMFNNLFRKHKYKYEIKYIGNIRFNKYLNTHYDFSDTFRAILYHIKCNLHKYNEIKKLRELISNVDRNYDEFDKPETDIKADMIPNNYCYFKLTKNIYCSFIYDDNDELNDENDKKNCLKSQKITINILSNTENIDSLNKYIDTIISDYTLYKNNKLLNNTYFFSLQNYNNELNMLDFHHYKFCSNTTFDTLFFEQKNDFLNQFNFFIKNKDFYNKLGIPYKLGILLHGYPGTGKTSLVKAIANATQRHIISVNMNKIKNIGLLEDLFFEEKIGNTNLKIPIDKRIYLISEFDVNGLNFLKDRKINYDDQNNNKDIESDNENDNIKEIYDNLEDESSNESNNEFYNENDKNVKNNNLILKAIKKNMSSNSDDDKITLGNFLETLDGCMECPGRIIIFTTNNASKIDPALLRPGRIDINIKFNKCNSEIIQKMYKFFFNKDIEIEKIENKFGEYKYSQAEIVNIFKQNFNNPEKIFE